MSERRVLKKSLDSQSEGGRNVARPYMEMAGRCRE
jgi:hypothetical protein